MIRYGKPSGALLEHKTAFFEQNDDLLAENERIAEIYARQPRREACKNCLHPLGQKDFTKLGIDCMICSRCGHLNGAHEDTEEFCAAIYTEGDGAAYAKNYSESDQEAFGKRVKDIYLPKAEFLSDALRELSIPPDETPITDIGAGSGYFVAAAREAGFASVHGFEVSRTQVDLANKNLGEGSVTLHSLDEIEEIVDGLETPVVSLIGVLEHLRDPRALLKAVKRNSKVEYLYLSLPLFSMTVMIELLFPKIMQRHLAGGHTHLYTESSIDWICGEFGYERVSEWWFGLDLVDLHRTFAVSLQQVDASGRATDIWSDKFLAALDAMQLALDEKRMSSEVHILLRAPK